MHEQLYDNKVINFIEFVAIEFLSRKIIILLCKYKIAFASWVPFFIMVPFFIVFTFEIVFLLYSFDEYIHTILNYFGNKSSCDLKETFVFFPKIFSKAHTFCAKFFIIIKNKCWGQVCFKANITHYPVKITKYSNY